MLLLSIGILLTFPPIQNLETALLKTFRLSTYSELCLMFDINTHLNDITYMTVCQNVRISVCQCQYDGMSVCNYIFYLLPSAVTLCCWPSLLLPYKLVAPSLQLLPPIWTGWTFELLSIRIQFHTSSTSGGVIKFQKNAL